MRTKNDGIKMRGNRKILAPRLFEDRARVYFDWCIIIPHVKVCQHALRLRRYTAATAYTSTDKTVGDRNYC